MLDDDERLTALLDNELGEDEKSALLERLAQDESLRQRLDVLRRDRDRLIASFDALLGQAPLERLHAAIPAADDETSHPSEARLDRLACVRRRDGARPSARGRGVVGRIRRRFAGGP